MSGESFALTLRILADVIYSLYVPTTQKHQNVKRANNSALLFWRVIMSKFLYKDEERSYALAGNVACLDSETLEAVGYENALSSYNNKHLLAAIAQLEKVVSCNPRYKDAQERLGYYRQELEGIQTNEILLREQLQQNPEDAETRFDLADTLYVSGNLTEAVLLWQELVAQKTGHWGKQARKMLERADNGNNMADTLK